MSKCHTAGPSLSWRPKKRHLALVFLIAAAAYQAHVQWGSIQRGITAAYQLIDAAVRDKIITTDGRVQDKVRLEVAPLLKRIEQLERARRRPSAGTCRSNTQRRRSTLERFQFPTTGN